MSGDTEGRWKASVTQEFGCEVKANGEDIAWVLNNNPEDAYLMAAAPELLEALTSLLAVVEQYDLPLSDPERIAARMAIAKARGEA